MLDERDLQAIAGLFDKKLDPINSRLDKIETRLDEMDARFDKIETRLDEMDTRFDKMESRLNDLENAQLQTIAKLENSVDKCIDVLYESHSLNVERLDKFDIESIKRNVDIAVILAKTASDKVDRYVRHTA